MNITTLAHLHIVKDIFTGIVATLVLGLTTIHSGSALAIQSAVISVLYLLAVIIEHKYAYDRYI